nr:GTPase IMAP family member GIMD1 [Nothobranchius furzeri]
MEMDDDCCFHGNNIFSILNQRGSHLRSEKRDALVLNVLLLGDRQSGRSSVGNALIGGQEFPTGICAPGVSKTTGCQIRSRSFPGYFRRQGAESDLVLRMIDTPTVWPRPQTLHEHCPEGVHVLMIVVRTDQPPENTRLQLYAQSVFGPDWNRHTTLIFTHADLLQEAGLQPSAYLAHTTDWLKALAKEVGGGVSFLDNTSDWPLIRGRPLRDQLLRLSARNHHRALKIRAEV